MITRQGTAIAVPTATPLADARANLAIALGYDPVDKTADLYLS